MTPSTQRRKQTLPRLDQVWLVAETQQGSSTVPGISLVASDEGLTVIGPNPATQHLIRWQSTTGFTCQRPSALPDGSPATVLEIGRTGGRTLQFLIPVDKVAPSETVVLEVQLETLAAKNGGRDRAGSAQTANQPNAAASPAPSPQTAASAQAPAAQTTAPTAAPPPRAPADAAPAAVAAPAVAPVAPAGAAPVVPVAPEATAQVAPAAPAATAPAAPAPAAATPAPPPAPPVAAQSAAPGIASAQAPAGQTFVAQGQVGPSAFAPATVPLRQQVAGQGTQVPVSPSMSITRSGTDAAPTDERERSSTERRLSLTVIALAIVVVMALAVDVFLVLYVTHNRSTSPPSAPSSHHAIGAAPASGSGRGNPGYLLQG